MSIKIGLIADIHAEAGPLEEALTALEREGVELILCAGDIAGYGTELKQCVDLLVERECIAILGNHDAWHFERLEAGQEKWFETFFHSLPLTWEETIEGIQILAVHASPPLSLSRGITLLDQYEKMIPSAKQMWADALKEYDFNVLVVGHTHQVFAEVLGRKLVINPGSTKFNHTCAVLSLPALEVRIIALSGKTPRKAWHWGS